jgi:hypothetical protein
MCTREANWKSRSRPVLTGISSLSNGGHHPVILTRDAAPIRTAVGSGTGRPASRVVGRGKLMGGTPRKKKRSSWMVMASRIIAVMLQLAQLAELIRKLSV